MTGVACAYCGDRLDPQSPWIWHRVQGWERKAKAASRKSGSDIALREAGDEYACDTCIRRLQSGVSPMQRTFL